MRNTIVGTSQGGVKKEQIETLRAECANGVSTKQYEHVVSVGLKIRSPWALKAAVSLATQIARESGLRIELGSTR